jgi:hypothetical protein
MPLGSYYEYNPRLPVHGLGDPALPQLSFADEVIRELLGGAQIGTYVPWAEQVSDTTWKEIPAEWTFACVAIQDATLKQVANLAGGHEVPFVAILMDRPATLNAIERSLYGTPYQLDSSQGLYPASASGTLPRIMFLVFCKLRDLEPGDGAGGGSTSMDAAAAQLGGKLVYVIQATAPASAQRPTVSFQQALAAQLGQQPVPVPVVTPVIGLPTVPRVGVTPVTAPLVPAPAAPLVATKSSTNTWLMVFAGAAAAAGLWWYAAKKKKAGEPIFG